jgi:hypothetical protein
MQVPQNRSMSNNIQNIKIDLIQWITTLDNDTVIKKIMDLRKSETEDWWNHISNDEKESIEKGIKDADIGNVKSHSAAKGVYGKWL